MSHPVTDDELIDAALAARLCAYAPYSDYQVGCAVLTGGQIYTGANIENASFGLTICAERIAAANAVLDGHREIEAVAVATGSSPPATPCGLCRQTLNEFRPRAGEMRIIVINAKGERSTHTLSELFPSGFSGDQIE